MDSAQLFTIYFAGLVGWRLHPGYLRDNAPPQPELLHLAALADEMVTITKEFESCRGYSLAEQ